MVQGLWGRLVHEVCVFGGCTVAISFSEVEQLSCRERTPLDLPLRKDRDAFCRTLLKLRPAESFSLGRSSCS